MATYFFGLLIILSTIHNSLQDVDCYVCTEYINEFQGQAPVGGNSRNLLNQCHGLADNYQRDIIRRCAGDSCFKAVTQVNEYVKQIYRTCATEFNCENFTPLIPGEKTIYCDKCKGNRCNSTANITASLFLIFSSLMMLIRNF